ncbi:hypothetical protein QUF63_16370 [Anaerolineales bacterium HSG25]|nr:hypothetical protein [Anaerolineales bacterium HSG25]
MNKLCGGQDDVGVQWVQPLLLATAKPVALHFRKYSVNLPEGASETRFL